MRFFKKITSLLLTFAMVFTMVGIAFPVQTALAQGILPFDKSLFRRPAPNITLDLTDVIRVGAADNSMGSGTTIKQATPSGVPLIDGEYALQAYDGETPAWPFIAFTTSEPVNITDISISGATAVATRISGSLSNTTSATWEIRGGTATAGSLLKVAITYNYTWNNPYTGVPVTDTYTTVGHSYVESVIFPAGIWAFTSAYSNVKNAADVQYVGRLLGRGVYGASLQIAANSGAEYSAGYFDFSNNSRVHDGDTTIPKKTMLIADPPHSGWGDKYIADGQGTFASGDGRRAHALVYLDSSVQTLESNNLRMHYFIHDDARSTSSDRDLTYETIHVRSGDVEYTGATGNVLGESHPGALAALNPSGPVDGTQSLGGGFLYKGMETGSTLYGSGAGGTYTLVTQWTARGDLPTPGISPNWMQYYHAITIDIINVTKLALRAKLNNVIGTNVKTVGGTTNVTTIMTVNGLDPENGGITNSNKGKNPQAWYYSAGWSTFSNAYEQAWKTLQKPSTTQTDIDNTLISLNGYVSSLVLAPANLNNNSSQFITTGLGNTFYGSQVLPLSTLINGVDNQDTEISEMLYFWEDGKYNYYTDSSRSAMEEAYNAATACREAAYNVIYQPYVDYCAMKLKEAIDGLELKEITITYNANGGTGEMSALTVQAGDTAFLDANQFELLGYTFAGWATTPSGAVVVEDMGFWEVGGDDITFYAKWTPNNYKVNYNGNGATGGVTAMSDHVYDTPKALNNNGFVRSGYTFAGWGLTPDDSSPAYANQQIVSNLVAQPNGSITLYALWTPSVYQIFFNANGASGSMASQSIAYSSTVTLAQNEFSLLGKAFRGWALSKQDADNGIIAYSDRDSLTLNVPNNITLYASWETGTYAITFNANAPDVTGTMDAQLLAFGQTANLTLNNFTRPGYTFTGWAQTPTGTKAYNNGASFTMNTEGAVLYAKWNPIVYSVLYKANGGSSAPGPGFATYDVPFNIPLAEPVRVGYTFLGWSVLPDSETAEFVPGQSVTNLTTVNGASVNLYAVWDANDNTSYKVEYYLEDLNGNYNWNKTNNFLGTTDTMAEAEILEYPGFVPNTEHPSYLASGTILGNGSLVLSVYYKRGRFTMTFDSDGGTAISPINGKFGAALTPPANPVKAGYTFGGWTPSIPPTIPDSDMTFTAQWLGGSFDLVFEGNTATGGSMAAQSFEIGATKALTANAYSKSGYSFAGWATTADGEPIYADMADYTMLTEGATLWAVWTANEHKITLFANTGTGADGVEIDTFVDTTVDLSDYDDYTKKGYTFAGWNTDPEADTGFWEYKAPATAASSLYAIYVPVPDIKVSFDLNGGTGTVPADQSGQQGTPVVLPAQSDISRPHFIFLGWAESADATEPLDNYAIPAANTTLYAVWARRPVTLNPEAGTSTVIDRDKGVIYGLREGLSTADFEQNFVTVGGDGELRYTFVGSSFGTGTTVDLVDRVTGETVETLVIVIFGDVNSDGLVNADDFAILKNIVTFCEDASDLGFAAGLAADVNADGVIDVFDLNSVKAAICGVYELEQNPL